MADTAAEFSKIAVIGLGLIGGSFARLVRHALPETHIAALDQSNVLSHAQADGVINAGLADLNDSHLETVDLIILGAHLPQNEANLKALDQRFSQPYRVMDLGSVKTPIVTLAEGLSEHLTFIGGHPMAGREVSGYANSRWDLFRGKRFLLTPCEKTPADFQAKIASWLGRMEMQPAVLEANTHDHLMALVSHFPQFYALALAHLLGRHQPEEALDFLGGGIDDQMRLMASTYDMWGPIFEANREHVDMILDDFMTVLTELKSALNKDNMAPVFTESRAIHDLYKTKRLSGK